MKKTLLSGLLFIAFVNYAQVDLSSNLKVCMPFNGNANDVSGSGNNGTVSGSSLTTDRFGNTSSAYQFNGTSDFISIANFANLAPTNELAISMWAKADVTTSNCLFALNLDNQSDRCVGCAQYNNGAGATLLIWDYGDILSGGRTSFSPVPADNLNWHHYVYIISQSNNIKSIYLDGVLKSNATYALSVSNKNLPFYIGAGASNGTGNSIRFRGKIDDVCIYNRALNSNEVSALFLEPNICSVNSTVTLTQPADTTSSVDFIIPNVFTPNEDGINDIFEFRVPINYSLNEFAIYNRWGNLIKNLELNTNNYLVWDGRTTSGEACSDGVYFYVVNYKNMLGEVKKKNGYINLIK